MRSKVNSVETQKRRSLAEPALHSHHMHSLSTLSNFSGVSPLPHSSKFTCHQSSYPKFTNLAGTCSRACLQQPCGPSICQNVCPPSCRCHCEGSNVEEASALYIETQLDQHPRAKEGGSPGSTVDGTCSIDSGIFVKFREDPSV